MIDSDIQKKCPDGRLHRVTPILILTLVLFNASVYSAQIVGYATNWLQQTSRTRVSAALNHPANQSKITGNQAKDKLKRKAILEMLKIGLPFKIVFTDIDYGTRYVDSTGKPAAIASITVRGCTSESEAVTKMSARKR